LAGQLKGLKPVPEHDKKKDYSFTLAVVHAILTSGNASVISEDKIDDFERDILQEFKDFGIPDVVYDNPINYGQQVAEHILKWAAEDKYKETKSLSQYSLRNNSASLKPTPSSVY